jgi:hypothetical protein
MPGQIGPSTIPRRSLFYAIAVATLGIFLVPTVRAATTWTITIDVHTGKDKPDYSFKYDVYPNCKNLPPAGSQDPENLVVCPEDTVYWDFVTVGTHKLLTMHQNQGFQPSGHDTWFRGDAATKPSVVIDKNDHGSTYEYCVAVYDDKGTKHQLYSHDPKIIIGGTLFAARIVELQKEFSPLLDEISKDSGEGEKARRKAKKIDEEIEKLKKLLQK